MSLIILSNGRITRTTISRGRRHTLDRSRWPRWRRDCTGMAGISISMGDGALHLLPHTISLTCRHSAWVVFATVICHRGCGISTTCSSANQRLPTHNFLRLLLLEGTGFLFLLKGGPIPLAFFLPHAVAAFPFVISGASCFGVLASVGLYPLSR